MKCFRCNRFMPEPDITEAIAREEDWRESFADVDDNDERVLICIPCADELDKME